ncbi:putative bifunctional diguanylate cyclase/phosphodiesterase [Noviherbaspirillum cavernae]|nr:EAL domain-containing protein [Noviherbaspirillum cavernae]
MNALLNSPSAAAGGEARGKARLLLVDDEPRLLHSLAGLLKEFNYDLATAAGGNEAMAQLSASHFDLVLLDLHMPDAGGNEVMDFIAARRIDTNVIVVSGETSIDAAIGALKRGAYGYLRKPYKPEELLNTVSNALQKRALEADNRAIAWRLECSERLYRYLVDSSPDIIYTIDPDGCFTYVNDRAQQLLGFRREELIGQHYSVLVHDDDLERARYVFNERRTGDRASRNVELRLKCRHMNDSKRVFQNTLLTISFNSTAMYSFDAQQNRKEFFGTYGIARDITDRKQAEMQLSHQAYHDILTDLPNRTLFRDRLDLAIIHAQRNKAGLAVMFVDLDHFKFVNDTLGHLKGDELLQKVTARFKEVLRRGDTLARLGGDEFTLLLPDLRDRQDAALVADKFLRCLEQPFELDRQEVHVSASIGIAIYPEDGETIDDLLRHADIAMYQVKGAGKNGHSFYHSSMQEASYQRIALEHSLRHAIERGELEMYYQPQVDARSGAIIGAEGLMRWNHPERGLLTAGEFLPFAEESGLMLPISDWMIGAVCRDLHEWNATGCEPARISINLSPQYLERGDFVRKLDQALQHYDIDASQIEVEITENICIRNPEHAIEQLNQLCELGVSVAIDDFGTGYSSLAYLHRFPISTIKIDQSFINEIQRDNGHYPVVLAVISIARGLDFNVIAEGVETECQSRYLAQAGCSMMQGYLFHKPMTRSELARTMGRKVPRVA